MRTIKELLQVMLDNQKYFHGGLCYWVYMLYQYNLITEGEFVIITNYITVNRPSKYSSIDAFIKRNSAYYWPFGKISPRIKWIKKHINLL
jgi:hypothetical protein